MSLKGYKGETISIDLLPSICFGRDKWPKNGFRRNPTKKQLFFIVPKKTTGRYYSERFWRLSFQPQERCILLNKQSLKPALRLLKKTIHSIGQEKIASYYLKNIALEEALTRNPSFWNCSLSFIFMHLLKKYRDYLNCGKIPYFWNKREDLLRKLRPETVENYHNQIANIIKTIEDNIVNQTGNGFKVAELILTREEANRLKTIEGM